MKKFYFLIVFIFLRHTSWSQPVFQWAKQFTGYSADVSVSDIALDASGSIYSTGYWWGTRDFDPGVDSLKLTVYSGNNSDCFIHKLDASGNLVWVKQIGAPNVCDEGNSIAVDDSGNIYVTGHFETTVDFDPGPEVFNLTANGVSDAFILKLDLDGNFLWAKNIGGRYIDDGITLSLDAAGNICIAGFYSLTTDFDPGEGVFNLTSSGGNDWFVLKLDASGNFMWAKSIGGKGSDDECLSLYIDASDNIYLTGTFEGIIDCDPGRRVSKSKSAGDKDVLIEKLNPSGSFVWTKTIGGTSRDIGNGIIADASGNVYISGRFSSIVDVDPGKAVLNFTSVEDEAAFILELDSTGNLVWATGFGSEGDDNAPDICLDASGNLYITGWFSGTVDFDPGVGIHNLTASGSTNMFLLKLDRDKNYVWVIKETTTGYGYGLKTIVDASYNIFNTGGFTLISDFDPGVGTFNMTSLFNAGRSGAAYFLKLRQ